jgi:putative aminopeptidase FrvX
VVLEALRLLAADRPAASVTAVATTQEEIGYSGGGARTSAYTVDPTVALVVDVTFATDSPGMEKKELGDHKLGGGPVLSRGSAAHPVVFDRLVEAAEKEGIPIRSRRRRAIRLRTRTRSICRGPAWRRD